jgi:hypothetical protein
MNISSKILAFEDRAERIRQQAEAKAQAREEVRHALERAYFARIAGCPESVGALIGDSEEAQRLDSAVASAIVTNRLHAGLHWRYRECLRELIEAEARRLAEQDIELCRADDRLRAMGITI